MFMKIPLLVIPLLIPLFSFDDFIQSFSWVILKITFVNLCKLIHNIVILVFSDPLNLKKMEKKGGITKNRISRMERAFCMK